MLPSNWAHQVLDPQRCAVFERILNGPDDGLRRAYRITQPATKEGCAVWLDLCRRYTAWFWAERRNDDFASRARRARYEQKWMARDGLL